MNLTSFTYSGTVLAGHMMAKVCRLEAALRQRPQVDCGIENMFRPGEYERRITIPPWTTLVGAEHRVGHLVRVVSGEIEVFTAEGLVMLREGDEFWSEPGVKRAGRTFATPCVFANVFANADDCQDLDILVERLTTSKNCELLGNRPTLEKRSGPWLSH